MRNRLTLLLLLASGFSGCNDNNPYKEGMHWDYSIICENGFKYKILNQRVGTILLLNKDGSPMKCEVGDKLKFERK